MCSEHWDGGGGLDTRPWAGDVGTQTNPAPRPSRSLTSGTELDSTCVSKVEAAIRGWSVGLVKKLTTNLTAEDKNILHGDFASKGEPVAVAA